MESRAATTTNPTPSSGIWPKKSKACPSSTICTAAVNHCSTASSAPPKSWWRVVIMEESRPTYRSPTWRLGHRPAPDREGLRGRRDLVEGGPVKLIFARPRGIRRRPRGERIGQQRGKRVGLAEGEGLIEGCSQSLGVDGLQKIPPVWLKARKRRGNDYLRLKSEWGQLCAWHGQGIGKSPRQTEMMPGCAAASSSSVSQPS